jgi:hypothetical protein
MARCFENNTMERVIPGQLLRIQVVEEYKEKEKSRKD